MNISKEQYEQAIAQKEQADKTITAYHKQEDKSANERWERFDYHHEGYSDEDLIYAAFARCKKCDAGMAYPKKCPSEARQWTCSDVLKNIGEGKGHDALPFAFYEVKSECQPSAHGATTRNPVAQ